MIEDVVRRFPEAGEFVVHIRRRHELAEMEIRVEVSGSEPPSIAAAVARDRRNGLGLRVQVSPVPYGTLPRFDAKARRFTDHRQGRAHP